MLKHNTVAKVDTILPYIEFKTHLRSLCLTLRPLKRA